MSTLDTQDHTAPAEPETPTRLTLLKTWEVRFLAIIFLVHLLISLQGFFEVYLAGHHGWNASLRGAIARNYNEHGFIGTGLLPYKHFEPLDDLSDPRAIVHWHHPPGINVLVGLSYAVFGEHEASARLVPVASSLITFFLLFFLVRRRHGPRPAIFAVAIFTLLPMQMTFGKMISYEPVVLAAALAALLCLEYARDQSDSKGRAAWTAACVASILFAGFVDWPGFIIAGFLGADALLRKPRSPLAFLAIGVASAAFLISMFYWLGSTAPEGALEKLANTRATGITFEKLRPVLQERMATYYVGLVLWTGGFAVVVETLRRRLDPTVFIFAAATVTYILAFKQASYIHSFFLYYVTPAITVAAALGVEHLVGASRDSKRVALVTVFWFGLLSWTVTAQSTTLHQRSYSIKPPKKPSRGVLLDGRLDMTLIGKYIYAHSDETDTIVMHPRTKLTMPLRFYSNRSLRRSSSLPMSPRPEDALYVAHADRLTPIQKRRLSGKYSVTILANHLIFDLRTRGEPDVKALKVQTRPWTLWHAYWTSSLYPPFTLDGWPERANTFRKKLEPPPAAKTQERK